MVMEHHMIKNNLFVSIPSRPVKGHRVVIGLRERTEALKVS